MPSATPESRDAAAIMAMAGALSTFDACPFFFFHFEEGGGVTSFGALASPPALAATFAVPALVT